MKLLKTNNKVKGHDYSKYSVNIPTETVKELGWKDSVELKFRVIRGKLIVEKV